MAPQEAIARAREQFGRDLIAGGVINYYLMDDIVDLFKFLGPGWLADSVFDAFGAYLDEVLAANQKVESCRSLLEGRLDMELVFSFHVYPSGDTIARQRTARTYDQFFGAREREDGSTRPARLDSSVRV